MNDSSRNSSPSSSQHSSQGKDRRRYFRINDQVGINYRVLDQEELAASSGKLRQKSELEQHGDQVARLLEKFSSRDPLLAELLQAMDKKLDVVIRQMELESRLNQRLAYRVQEVSISACGLALTLDVPLLPDTYLELQLSLLPGDHCVQCHGVVLDSEKLDSGEGYSTRIDFCDMASRDQETLIQHVVQRQSKLLGDSRSRSAV